MKRLSSFALAAALLCGGAARAHEGHGDKEGAVEGHSETLEGEILDMACYLSHDAKGPKHAKCAKKCALAGSPIGLLTADGSVYLLVDDHAKEKAFEAAKELAGENAKITGKLAKKSGIAALIVEKAEKSK